MFLTLKPRNHPAALIFNKISVATFPNDLNRLRDPVGTQLGSVLT